VHRIRLASSVFLFLSYLLVISGCLSKLEGSPAAERRGPWKGKVTIQTNYHLSGKNVENGKPYEDSSEASLHCEFDDNRGGNNARCTYSGKGRLSGPDGSTETTQEASDAATHVWAGFSADGSLGLGISGFLGRSTITSPYGSASDPASYGSFNYTIPAASASETGSWTDTKVLGSATTITTIQWSITSLPQPKIQAPEAVEIPAPKKPRDSDVTLDGCTKLGLGQQATVTAKGRPAGGSYRFWAEPSSPLSVTGQGSTATVRGSEPGKGTLYVQYTAPNGKNSQASQSATSLLIESINGGQPIPEIDLYDEMGKSKAATLTVPVSVKPAEAGDEVVYKPANPAVLTAVGQGDTVLLQGVHEGKTTIQGTTQCSGGTGPVVTVKVVRCSKETLERMHEKEKIVEERLKEGLQEAQELVNEKELKEAEGEVWKHGAGALAQTAEVITAGAGLFSHLGQAGEALERMLTAANAGLEGWESIQQGLDGAMKDTMMSAFSGGYAAAYRLAHAWELYGKDLVRIGITSDRLSDLAERNAKGIRELDDLQKRRKSVCGDSETVPPTQPTEPGKQPPKPPSKPPQTRGQSKPPSEQPVDQPSSQPSADEPPAEPPVPPTTTPTTRTGGFMMPQGCDCSSTDTGQWNNTAAGFKAMGAGLKASANCAQTFQQQADGYTAELAFVFNTLTTVKAAAALSKEQGVPKLKAALANLKSSQTKIGQFSQVAKGVSASVGQCSSAQTKAGEIISMGLSQK
jgi:hypothetical protein